MFVYRSRFLRRGEVWFDAEPAAGTGVDWIYHRQRSRPLANHRSKPFHTRLIDLRPAPSGLLAAMDPRTVAKITDAQDKDKLRCEPCDTRDPKLMDEIEERWNRFALAQNTPRLERAWLEPFRAAGALDVVAARDRSGTVLVHHVVLLTPGRARQLIAIAPYQPVPDMAWRNAVSRANCLVHWHNFTAYRQRGIDWFDFGGWYRGTTDITLLGINAFKKSFGGTVVEEFDCEQPVTLKGRTALALARLWGRLKQARRPVNPEPERKPRATVPDAPGVSPALR